MDIANLFFFNMLSFTYSGYVCMRVTQAVFQDPGTVIAGCIAFPSYITLVTFFSSVSANAIIQYSLIQSSQELAITDSQLSKVLNYGLPSTVTLALAACMMNNSPPEAYFLMRNTPMTDHSKLSSVVRSIVVISSLVIVVLVRVQIRRINGGNWLEGGHVLSNKMYFAVAMVMALCLGPRQFFFEDSALITTDIVSLVVFVFLPGYIVTTNCRIRHHLELKLVPFVRIPNRDERRVFALIV